MGTRQLANTEENWVFDTSRYSQNDVEKIFNAIQADKKHITLCIVVVSPRRGHERAIRYICSVLFKRIRGAKAKDFLKQKTTT